jgi:hypothetical protein
MKQGFHDLFLLYELLLEVEEVKQNSKNVSSNHNVSHWVVACGDGGEFWEDFKIKSKFLLDRESLEIIQNSILVKN